MSLPSHERSTEIMTSLLKERKRERNKEEKGRGKDI